MELQHAGKKKQMKKKIESSVCFQVLYKGENKEDSLCTRGMLTKKYFFHVHVMHVQCCCFADLRLRPLESGYF